jgi:hypothetical protein
MPSISIALPQVISIDFPSDLKNVNTDIFVKNIQKSISIKKEQLKYLEQIINKLSNACYGLEKCHINANHFSVQDDNHTIFLGEIQLNQYSRDLKYQYELSLILGDKEKIIFSWSDDRMDVLSIYEKEKYQVAMHYFADISKHKEVLYIDENQKTTKNSLMISLDTKMKEYRLRSNYISKEKSASFNILVKDEVLLEENENIFTLNSDFPNVKEGAYVLFSSMQDIQPLNLLEVFESSLGSFLFFDNKLQGFTHRNVASSTLVDEALIPSEITALD